MLVEQLLREAGGRGGEQVSLLAELVDRVEEGGAEAGQCDKFRSLVEGVRASLGDSARQGTFERLDSMLVEAVREGKWLVIDNANYCSASVLDRLNCLLESGSVLSEWGVLGGEVPTP